MPMTIRVMMSTGACDESHGIAVVAAGIVFGLALRSCVLRGADWQAACLAGRLLCRTRGAITAMCCTWVHMLFSQEGTQGYAVAHDCSCTFCFAEAVHQVGSSYFFTPNCACWCCLSP